MCQFPGILIKLSVLVLLLKRFGLVAAIMQGGGHYF